MSKVINIIGVGSNVGKTILMEGLIKEIKARGFSVGTIKHDVHNFDIDKKGKDTYRHREAGSETVIISSKNRLAVIKEIKEEATLDKLIEIAKDKDFILIEGYKNSNLRKIEVFREDITAEIITPK
ncbi:molybdopterin-guanine dinucleotide biosynthesis protein B [Clostridium chauvoei]|nr:molybdopterin-guanine dinucleotide biosynthesis protein B [Clostridium chauvoei]